MGPLARDLVHDGPSLRSALDAMTASRTIGSFVLRSRAGAARVYGQICAAVRAAEQPLSGADGEIPAGLDPAPHAENTALVARSLRERAKGIDPALLALESAPAGPVILPDLTPWGSFVLAPTPRLRAAPTPAIPPRRSGDSPR